MRDGLVLGDREGAPALNSSYPGRDFGGGGCLKLLLSSLPDCGVNSLGTGFGGCHVRVGCSLLSPLMLSHA